jgi:hypothetical protein
MSDPESVASLRARLLQQADWYKAIEMHPETDALLRDAAERLAVLEQERDEACREFVSLTLAQGDWQPIETAPEKTPILVWVPADVELRCGGGPYRAVKVDGEWFSAAVFSMKGWARAPAPTHWMPLPDPPKVEASRA